MMAAESIVREAATLAKGLALGILVTIPIAAQSISTYAGGGTADGRPATLVALHQTRGIAVDGSGNIYVAEPEQHRVRHIDASTGVITTVAGVGAQGFSGDGGPATRATL